MTELHWKQSEDKKMFSLFAGCNDSELATLNKRAKWWEAVIWLPDCHAEKQYGTFENQIVSVEKSVVRWFGLANTSRPAMDRPDA